MNECKIDDCREDAYTMRHGLCRPHHRKLMKYGDPEYVRPERGEVPLPGCTVGDCGNEARSVGAIYCKMHYHRWYRHGSPVKVSWGAGITASKGRRYRALTLHGHPLAKANGRVYEHRAVLYDALNGRDAGCHYCGVPLKWASTRGDADVLQVDHLNDDGGDNRPENLVPACVSCNIRKAQNNRRRALLEEGYWAVNDTVAALEQEKMRRKGFDRSKIVPMA